MAMIRAPSLALGSRLLRSSVLLVLSLLLPTCHGNDVTAPVPTQLSFSTQPSTTSAGQAISPVAQVAALDASGRVVSGFTGNVTVAIGTNPGGGTLLGGTTVAAVNGVATFPSLSLDKSGTGYTLTATATGLSAATSASFSILAGLPTQLVFTRRPSPTLGRCTVAGAMISPPVQVTARDAFGNLVPSFTENVTVALTPGTGTSGAALGGATIVTAVGGVATFSTLSIDKIGSGYTLTATTMELTTTSMAFNTCAPGPATQLAFTVQPQTSLVGWPIFPAVQVTARDAQGNTATSFTDSVTATIAGSSGATLSGTTTVAAVAGVSTFSTLCTGTDRVGGGYTLTAATAGLPGATSAPFGFAVDGFMQLVFTVQPSTTLAGATIAPAVQVTALDSRGNVYVNPCFRGPVRSVTVAIGTGTSGATLGGTTTVALVSGVATFSTLSIDKVGSGYTLVAMVTGGFGTASSPFNIQ